MAMSPIFKTERSIGRSIRARKSRSSAAPHRAAVDADGLFIVAFALSSANDPSVRGTIFHGTTFHSIASTGCHFVAAMESRIPWASRLERAVRASFVRLLYLPIVTIAGTSVEVDLHCAVFLFYRLPGDAGNVVAGTRIAVETLRVRCVVVQSDDRLVSPWRT